jgi:hypothetical protein
MIQLICRWMCPESLHVYRRMGVAEHERHIKRASLCNVDLIQTVNVPKVFADQGLAQLVNEYAGPRSADSQRAYEEALRAALDPFDKDQGQESRAPAPQPKRRAGRPQPTPNTEPCQHDSDRPGGALEGRPPAGAEVAIPSSLWPDHPCTEMGGLAWHAQIISTTSSTALVKFTKAQTRTGQRYQDVRLQLGALRTITQQQQADAPQQGQGGAMRDGAPT